MLAPLGRWEATTPKEALEALNPVRLDSMGKPRQYAVVVT